MDLCLGLLGLTAALALSGCSGHSTRTTGAGPTEQAPLPPAETPAAAAAPPPSVSATASSAASASPSTTAVATAAAATPAGPPRCTSAHLALMVGEGDAGAGTSYTPLALRNAGTATCHLTGFPGVSFLDSDGRQVGRPARMTPLARQQVVLAPGDDAYALLAVANAGAYDLAECAPKAAARVRVYPPGDRIALTAAFPVDVCTGASVTQSRVDPVRKGDGPG